MKAFLKEQSKAAAKQNLHPVQRAIAVGRNLYTIDSSNYCRGLILVSETYLEGIQFESLGGQIVEHFYNFGTVSTAFYGYLVKQFSISTSRYYLEYCKKMGTTQILGIVLGITLVSPQLLNAYSVASTAAADIPFWDFGFAQLTNDWLSSTSHSSDACWFMLAYLERFFRKYIPQSISMIFVPLFSLPTVLAATCHVRSCRLDNR